MAANAQSAGRRATNSMTGTAANAVNAAEHGAKGTNISIGRDGKTYSANRSSGVKENAGSAEIPSILSMIISLPTRSVFLNVHGAAIR